MGLLAIYFDKNDKEISLKISKSITFVQNAFLKVVQGYKILNWSKVLTSDAQIA